MSFSLTMAVMER